MSGADQQSPSFVVGIGASSEGLEAVSAADAGDKEESQHPVNKSEPSPTLRKRRVMIVDDHEEIRTSISRLVREWGHEVVTAADGETALSLAETFQPECAIVDLSMPGMNGIEVCRRLRKRFPQHQLYLIAMSGYAGADLRDACLAQGFDAYLTKPGDIPTLERLLGGDRMDSAASQH